MTMKKYIGIGLTLIGLLMTIVALSADYLGLGDVDPDHFTLGTKQIAGAVFGAVVFVGGLIVWLKR